MRHKKETRKSINWSQRGKIGKGHCTKATLNTTTFFSFQPSLVFTSNESLASRFLVRTGKLVRFTFFFARLVRHLNVKCRRGWNLIEVVVNGRKTWKPGWARKLTGIQCEMWRKCNLKAFNRKSEWLTWFHLHETLAPAPETMICGRRLFRLAEKWKKINNPLVRRF